MNTKTAQEPLFIAKDRAMDIIEPHYGRLEGSVRDGWADWEALPPKQRVKLNGRARASCLYDFIIDHVRRRFADVPNITFFERRGLFMLGIDGLVTLRFKKLRYGKKTSNIQTTQQMNIFGRQLDLPGVPKAARLTVGYMLDVSQSFIKSVLVTLQMGNEVMWDFSLSTSQQTLAFPDSKQQQEAQVNVKTKAPLKKTSDS